MSENGYLPYYREELPTRAGDYIMASMYQLTKLLERVDIRPTISLDHSQQRFIFEWLGPGIEVVNFAYERRFGYKITRNEKSGDRPLAEILVTTNGDSQETEVVFINNLNNHQKSVIRTDQFDGEDRSEKFTEALRGNEIAQQTIEVFHFLGPNLQLKPDFQFS